MCQAAADGTHSKGGGTRRQADFDWSMYHNVHAPVVQLCRSTGYKQTGCCRLSPQAQESPALRQRECLKHW